MRFASEGNLIESTPEAVQAAVASIQRQLAGTAPDLVCLFVTPQHGSVPNIGQLVRSALGARHLIGCTAESIAAGPSEYEGGPAIAIWAAVMPGCEIHPYQISFERTPDGLLAQGAPAADHLTQTPQATLLVADPFTCPVDSLLGHFADEFPGLPVIGGMASGATQHSENRLYLDDAELTSGVVGVVLGGPIRVRSVVSQGCRPIGQPLVVTKANRNVIHELGGRSAFDLVNQLYREADPTDQGLIQRGLHVGLAMSEYRERFERGDFLIANIVGADRDTGALALGHLVRTGQTVQFHVRDARTADEDLRSLLSQAVQERSAAGGLLFSCNGRGTRLFQDPHHDAATIADLAGAIPLAGFFAQGEFGPIAGQNYIHGFTASVALFGAP